MNTIYGICGQGYGVELALRRVYNALSGMDSAAGLMDNAMILAAGYRNIEYTA